MKWIVAVIVALCLTSAAHAGPRRVVVLELEGPNAATIRRQLVELVGKSYSVVSLEAWNRAAKKAKATRPTAANIRKVARALDIDAVIDGTIADRRSGYRVRVRLRDASGAVVEEASVTTKNTTFDKAARRDLRDEIVDVIATLPGETRKARRR